MRERSEEVVVPGGKRTGEGTLPLLHDPLHCSGASETRRLGRGAVSLGL